MTCQVRPHWQLPKELLLPLMAHGKGSPTWPATERTPMKQAQGKKTRWLLNFSQFALKSRIETYLQTEALAGEHPLVTGQSSDPGTLLRDGERLPSAQISSRGQAAGWGPSLLLQAPGPTGSAPEGRQEKFWRRARVVGQQAALR